MRKIITILLLLLNCVIKSQVVAYYPLSSNANDYSGNGYNGTLNGATIEQYHGISIGAALFNASLENISLPSMSFSSPVVTFSFWLNSYYNSTQTRVFYRFGNAPDGTSFLIILASNSSNDLRVTVDNATSGTTVLNSTNYLLGFDNKWVYVTIVYNQPNKTIYFYRNGDLFSTATTTNNILDLSAAKTATIGSTTANQSATFYICEFKAINENRTAAQVKTMYMLYRGMLQ